MEDAAISACRGDWKNAETAGQTCVVAVLLKDSDTEDLAVSSPFAWLISAFSPSDASFMLRPNAPRCYDGWLPEVKSHDDAPHRT